MEEARKKLRICMVLVVTAAIIVGLIYYFHDVRGRCRRYVSGKRNCVHQR